MADRNLYLPTLQELKLSMGRGNKLLPFLERSTLDQVVWFDDFLGDQFGWDATTPGKYEVVTGVDGSIDIYANQTNGVARMEPSSGAGASGEYCGLSLPELNFQSQLNCVMAARINLDAITTVKVEIGFTDVTTDAGAVNALATPTATADDACVWVFDTDDTAYWQCYGSKAATPATKIEPEIAPVAATWETMIVALEGTNAKFIRLDANGKKTYESTWMTDAITATDKLVPWVFVQLRGAVDRHLDIDYIYAAQRRTTT